jgi:hypothetical protein
MLDVERSMFDVFPRLFRLQFFTARPAVVKFAFSHKNMNKLLLFTHRP